MKLLIVTCFFISTLVLKITEIAYLGFVASSKHDASSTLWSITGALIPTFALLRRLFNDRTCLKYEDFWGKFFFVLSIHILNYLCILAHLYMRSQSPMYYVTFSLERTMVSFIACSLHRRFVQPKQTKAFFQCFSCCGLLCFFLYAILYFMIEEQKRENIMQHK